MEVPGWLLILLSVFSGMFLVIALLFLYTVITNRLRRRKYDRIIQVDRYVPGKIMAYFKGNDGTNSSVIPKTYPAAMQTWSPVPAAPRKMIRNTGSRASDVSDTSDALHNLRKSSSAKAIDQRAQMSHHASQIIGGNIFRKSSRVSVDVKRRGPSSVSGRDDGRRPRSCYGRLETIKSGESPRSRYGSFEETINNGEYIHRPTVDGDQVYPHIGFFTNVENTPVFDDQDSPVISYDQHCSPISEPCGPGSLFFILEYNSHIPELLITIMSGVDLPTVSGGVNSSLNSYVNFCLVPEDFLWQRTNVVIDDKDPVYNETFRIPDVLYHKLREYTLCFYIMDCTQVTGERVIGKVLYPLSDLRAEDRVEVCKELSTA